MPPEDALYEFERQADERIGALRLWQCPLRSILSVLILTADAAFSGGRFGRNHQPNPERGATIISRTSYLVPFMQVASSETGSDLQNALDVLGRPHIQEIKDALVYSHFCEIMPQVRNGYLSVEVGDNGFVLGHPSRAFSEHEERDIVANELSLSAIVKPAPFQVPALLRMVADWPRLDAADLLNVLRGAYEYYLTAVIERELMELSAYETAFGFDRSEYVSVRAALIALGSWCIGMAAAAEATALKASSGEAERWQRESLEWAAPLLNANFVLGLIQGLAGIKQERVDRVVRFFVDEPLNDRPVISGEGFLAPLIRLGGAFIFSPRALLIMLGERNILYVANKQDRLHFNEVVSSNLEPELLSQAERVFARCEDTVVRRNVLWERGEIDLLVYSLPRNTALQIQAKVPIPPQGARMTRQVEQNTLEAIRQLRAFEEQDGSTKDAVASNAVGLECSEVRWASAVLVGSSFGTSTAWSALNGIAALNIPILALVLERMRNEGDKNLLSVPTIADQVLRDVIARGSRGWVQQQFNVLGKSITLPILDLNYEELAAAKEEAEAAYPA